jgi:glycosyltransferase involved in cell wall biosynthesis
MSYGQPGGIAFFSHSSNVAGAERALVVAVEQARHAGHESVVYLPGDGPLVHELEELEVPWEHYEFVQQFSPTPESFAPEAWRGIWPGLAARVASIRGSLQRRRTRLVYINTIYPVESALAAAHLGLPVIWHPHELFHERFHDWLLGTPLFAALMGALSDEVISVSAVCKEALRPYVPAEKLLQIYEPVDWAALQQRRPVPEDLRAEWEQASFVLACVGSIDPRKAQADLLEALTRMPVDLASGILTWIVGTPSNEELGQAFLAHLDRLPAHVRVRWLGQREDVAAILQAADVLVHPSINDPFPMTVLEALASGTPVVAARGGGVIESIADGATGRLVPCSDPSALAAALVDVLGDPDGLRVMGEAGRAAVRRYDVQVYRGKIAAALEQALALDVDCAARRRLVDRFETKVTLVGRLAVELEELRQTSARNWKEQSEVIQRLTNDCSALDRDIRTLSAEIERLKRMRSYRMGATISSSRGLGDALRLPGRLLRIALAKRDGSEPRGD